MEKSSRITVREIYYTFRAVYLNCTLLTNVFVSERNKAAGTLAPFDPSAHYIHPRSRIRNTIIINPKRAFAKNPALKNAARSNKKVVSIYEDSEPEELPDSEEEDEDANDDGEYGARPRRSSGAKKPVKDLPFSPKKKRARKGFVVPDSDDEEDDESEIEEVAPARRSSRSTKNIKARYTEAEEYVDDEDEDEDGESDDRPRKSRKGKPQKSKTKKIVRGKASRPAYGNVRHIADLDYDALSDEETAPLRAHRDVCEKCHRGPAHDLIEAAGKKPKGRGRKKKDEDLDDFEGDEIERLTALGGWVRW
jgi:chromodomain-helicase-DNA-binding protein 4